MQGTFDKLQKLQDILSQKFDIEKDIEGIPKNLATKTELLNRLKKSYIEKNEQYENTKDKIKALKHEMAEAERQREEFEKRMDVISTQREYEALEKEIKGATEREQKLRRDIQREERAVEDMLNNLQREEQMISQQEEELKVEQEKNDVQKVSKEDLLKQLEKEESQVVPGMDEEILFKFERIIRNKSGLGIVPVSNGICNGCHMILPKQFVNDVRLGKEILFCPYCSRILFFQENETEVESTYMTAEVGGLSDLVDDFDLD
ncbi:MAG: nucleic acid-binding protein [Spirochaetaceae bacterium 4572_59]|nr:MAG: nucleic acid-binding protein [Spirochaetaceae bacterium 4572_59]